MQYKFCRASGKLRLMTESRQYLYLQAANYVSLPVTRPARVGA